MRAAIFEVFQGPIRVRNVPDPTPTPDGVVIRVQANGICRSDWHGWMGHDSDVTLPHVPGHELAGVVEAVGSGVCRWRVGDRVTVPFVAACGGCPQCASGNHQVCDHQFQPGFTAWGSFAEFVAIERADVNLVRLPDEMDFVTAAGLGCRFTTAFRAVVEQGRVGAGQWVAVHGCGGVGLSAVMIARAVGARVIAVDVRREALEFAARLGADAVIDASTTADVPGAVMEASGGGTHVAVDALGSLGTCRNGILGLRTRGRHVQAGLMLAGDADAAVPMARVIAKELEIVGTHGMAAHRFPAMLDMVASGRLAPQKLVTRTVSLDESTAILETMAEFPTLGVTVIDRF